MHYSSDDCSDEDFPDDTYGDEYLFVPSKRDLDLGARLVRRFGVEVAPHLADEIRAIFSRKGAYSRFKRLLEEARLLDQWYDFEAAATEKAIRDWCHENGIELIEPHPPTDA